MGVIDHVIKSLHELYTNTLYTVFTALFQMQACMLSYHVDAARVLVTAHALQRSHANGGALENHTTAGKAIYTFSYDINKNVWAILYPFKEIV